MNENELLKDIYDKFKTGEYVRIPSMKQIDNHKWVVYFYEDGIIHSGIYYTQERAQIKLRIENDKL